jgi:hypothetical protein
MYIPDCVGDKEDKNRGATLLSAYCRGVNKPSPVDTDGGTMDYAITNRLEAQ